MSELDLLRTGADGMARQRAVLDLSARNVAAAQASTAEHPYHRLVAAFGDDASDGMFETRETAEPVDALSEMVAMLDAQRAYEADASIFDVGKRIAERALDVERP